MALMSLACGFLIFDLWNRILKRLYTGGAQKYLVIFEEALTLIVAITAICKAVDMQAKLLLVMPAIHTLVEALQVTRIPHYLMRRAIPCLPWYLDS